MNLHVFHCSIKSPKSILLEIQFYLPKDCLLNCLKKYIYMYINQIIPFTSCILVFESNYCHPILVLVYSALLLKKTLSGWFHTFGKLFATMWSMNSFAPSPCILIFAKAVISAIETFFMVFWTSRPTGSCQLVRK